MMQLSTSTTEDRGSDCIKPEEESFWFSYPTVNRFDKSYGMHMHAKALDCHDTCIFLFYGL